MELSYIINELAESREDYFRAIAPPLIQTSNFAFKTVDDLRKSFEDEYSTWLYSRGLNPTVEILRKKLAALDGAEDCLVFNSGAAAIFASVLANVKSGDHILSVKNPYTWAKKMFEEILPRFQVTHSYIHGTAIENFENAILLFIQGYSFADIVVMDLEKRHQLATHAQEKAWLFFVAKILVHDIYSLPEPVITDLFNYLKEIGTALYDEEFGKRLFVFLGQPTLSELCYISKKYKQLMGAIPEITLNDMASETKSELAMHCMSILHLIRKSHISILDLLSFDQYTRLFLYGSVDLVSILMNEGGLSIKKLPILLTMDNEVRSQLTQTKNLDALRNGEMTIEQFAPSEVTKSLLELFLDFESYYTKHYETASNKATITRSRSFGSFFDEKPNPNVFKENRDIQSKGSVCLL